MKDRDAFRNRLAFALAGHAHELPALPTGKRSVVIVFADEPVGPVFHQIRADFAGHAHVVVLNEHSSDLSIITFGEAPPGEQEQADLLKGSVSFGTLLCWLHDCHDGRSPIAFVIDHESVGVAESPVDPSMRKLAAA